MFIQISDYYINLNNIIYISKNTNGSSDIKLTCGKTITICIAYEDLIKIIERKTKGIK